MHLQKMLFSFIFLISIAAKTHAVNNDDFLLQEFANFSLSQDPIVEIFEHLDNEQPRATIFVHFKTTTCLEKIYAELSKYPHIKHLTIHELNKKRTQKISHKQFADFMQKVFNMGIKIHLPFLQPNSEEESTSKLDPNLY